MTPSQFDAAIDTFNTEHTSRCSEPRLVSITHLDGRDWFSWSHECLSCGATISTTLNRYRNQRTNHNTVEWTFPDE